MRVLGELLSGTPPLTGIPVITGVLVGVWLIPIELGLIN
jgi:hypothetical protein